MVADADLTGRNGSLTGCWVRLRVAVPVCDEVPHRAAHGRTQCWEEQVEGSRVDERVRPSSGSSRMANGYGSR